MQNSIIIFKVFYTYREDGGEEHFPDRQFDWPEGYSIGLETLPDQDLQRKEMKFNYTL